MNISNQVITRLTDTLEKVKTIKSAAELADLRADTKRNTIYVGLLKEAASDNSLANGVRQLVTATVAIVIAVSNRRDNLGGNAMNDIHIVRDEITRALLGWQADEMQSDMTYKSGQLLEMSDGVVWWQDEYKTDFLISSNND